MGRQVKFGVRIHQHGYTFDDLKRVSSTLAQYIGSRRATISKNTGSITCARRAFGGFTGRKKWFRFKDSLALRVSGAARYVRLEGRSYRMQHRRELRNLNLETTLTRPDP